MVGWPPTCSNIAGRWGMIWFRYYFCFYLKNIGSYWTLSISLCFFWSRWSCSILCFSFSAVTTSPFSNALQEPRHVIGQNTKQDHVTTPTGLPLVRPESCVRPRKQVFFTGIYFVKLDSKTGEAVVLLIIWWHCTWQEKGDQLRRACAGSQHHLEVQRKEIQSNTFVQEEREWSRTITGHGRRLVAVKDTH